MTWPIVEFDHRDPLLTRAAITGVYVYRQTAIRSSQNLMIFGDNPSGEIFYVNADKLPGEAASDAIRAHPAQRQGHAEDAAADHPREERRAGQAAGDARRSSLRRRPGRPDLRDEQARRRNPSARSGQMRLKFILSR